LAANASFTCRASAADNWFFAQSAGPCRIKERIDAMHFDWDEAKNQRTLKERGFSFEYAARILLGPTLERQDDRREYGEVRVQAIGQAAGDILFVVYTDPLRRLYRSR
jgi:uncharacterized DUF497 family protein